MVPLLQNKARLLSYRSYFSLLSKNDRAITLRQLLCLITYLKVFASPFHLATLALLTDRLVDQFVYAA